VQGERVGRRNHAMAALEELAAKERHYYSLNRRYSETFEELGLDRKDWEKMPPDLNHSLYIYSISDNYYPQNSYSMRYCSAAITRIKRDESHIYAYYCTNEGLLDALSSDFNGNIQVIKSTVWPLPGP
jgi:Tfp pilus assembly protein PilE